jgi:hypothetical protein
MFYLLLGEETEDILLGGTRCEELAARRLPAENGAGQAAWATQPVRLVRRAAGDATQAARPPRPRPSCREGAPDRGGDCGRPPVVHNGGAV